MGSVRRLLPIMTSLLDRHANKIQGVLGCFDRVLIQGTLPGLCFAQGMTDFLYQRQIRIFDYAKFAEPLREQIRQNAERIATTSGVQIEFIRRSKGFRKEQRIADVLARRGAAPGLVHILSAMEECASYKPWYDKKTGQTFLKPDSGRCLHYYFYFIDPDWGLCFLRVPTWCPFRLQFYFNGHNHLAQQLRRHNLDFQQLDNSFVSISDFAKAQQLADSISVAKLHRALDRFAALYCPVLSQLGVAPHWSILQAEYSTDIVFRSQDDLRPLYEQWVRTAVHAVKADNVATFLGRKLHPNYQDEAGNDLSHRIGGTRLKHTMGPVSIKLYDKRGIVLRIETTVNDVSFFSHYRKVEHRGGSTTYRLAPLKKSIYSLNPDLRQLLAAANRRYLDFLSDLSDPTAGLKALDKVSKPVHENGHTFKGFNFFHLPDLSLFEVLVRGEFNISGMRNRTLRHLLKDFSTNQISRFLKRLRTHGLIKKIGRTYKYYLTDFGRHVATAGLKLKELFLIPALAPSVA